MTYNGYVNYETWNVSLWLNNDQGTNEYYDNLACEILDENEGDLDRTRYELSNRIRDEITEYNPLGDQASMFSDLLNHALGMVEWAEVADSFVESAKEQRENENE